MGFAMTWATVSDIGLLAWQLLMEGENQANTQRNAQPDMPQEICKCLIRYMGGDSAAQTRLDSTRNAQGKQIIWLEVLAHLNELGYQGTRWETVQAKWNNLCSRFKDEKCKHALSGAPYDGTWVYFAEMQESVGTRAKFTRVAPVDSSEMRMSSKKPRREQTLPQRSTESQNSGGQSGSDPEFIEEEDAILDSSNTSTGDSSFHMADMPKFITKDKGMRDRWARMTPQQKHIFLTSKQMKADEEDKEKTRTMMTDHIEQQQQTLKDSYNLLERFVSAYESKPSTVAPAQAPSTAPPEVLEFLKGEMKNFMEDYSHKCYTSMQNQFSEFLRNQNFQPVSVQKECPPSASDSRPTKGTTSPALHMQAQVVHGLSKNYLSHQMNPGPLPPANTPLETPLCAECSELHCSKEAFYGYKGLRLACHDHFAQDMEYYHG